MLLQWAPFLKFFILPKYTAVPGVKNWMLGVANVRGDYYLSLT